MNYTSRAPNSPAEHDIPRAAGTTANARTRRGINCLSHILTSRITRSRSIPHAETLRQSWNLLGRCAASVDGPNAERNPYNPPQN
jgi:hypothetical protein